MAKKQKIEVGQIWRTLGWCAWSRSSNYKYYEIMEKQSQGKRRLKCIYVENKHLRFRMSLWMKTTEIYEYFEYVENPKAIKVLYGESFEYRE